MPVSAVEIVRKQMFRILACPQEAGRGNEQMLRYNACCLITRK